jgi:putative transposase
MSAVGQVTRGVVFTLVAVGRFYPSSKTCSHCGAVKAKLPLWERAYHCDHCGTSIDRDVNAARNIAREATRLIAQPTMACRTSTTVPGYDRTPQTPPRDQVRPPKRKPRRQGRLREEPSSGRPEGDRMSLGRDAGNGVRNGNSESREPPSHLI